MTVENRKQILFVASYLPRSKGGGAEQRIATTLEALATLGDVHLLLNDIVAASTHQPVLEDVYKKQIKTVVRVADMAKAVPDLFGPLVKPSRVSNLLWNAWVTTGRVVKVSEMQTKELISAVRAQTNVQKFQIVLAHQAHTAFLINDALKELITGDGVSLLDWDAAEVPAMRAITHQLLLTRKPLKYFRSIWNNFKLTMLERVLLNCWDVAICASYFDMDYFVRKAPNKKIYVLPNSINLPSTLVDSSIQPINNHQVVFVATMNYWPNAQGALMFLKEIWPKVKAAVPDAEIMLVGRGPSAELRAFNGRDGIHVVGEVDSVGPYYAQASVAIAPMMFSVGSAIKILEALAYKKPLVGFEASTQRHGLVDGVHVSSAKTKDEFAEKLIKLLDDSNLRDLLIKTGRGYVEEYFDRKMIIKKLAQFLAT